MKILPQSFSFISFAAFLDFHAEEGLAILKTFYLARGARI